MNLSLFYFYILNGKFIIGSVTHLFKYLSISTGKKKYLSFANEKKKNKHKWIMSTAQLCVTTKSRAKAVNSYMEMS